MDKAQALEALEDADHCIFYVEAGQAIAAAFDIEAPVRTFTQGQGRVQHLEGGTGEGIDAAELACAIADSLGLSYPPMTGIGSRLRVACAAIREHLS